MALPEREFDVDDGDVLSLVSELLSEAKSEQKRYVSKWNRYYRAFRNRTWGEHRASHLPSPQSPQIFPTYDLIASFMTDQHPEMYVASELDFSDYTTPPPEDVVKQKTEDAQRLLASWWVTSGAAQQMGMALTDSLNFGCGILKTGLDLAKCRGLGESTLTRVDPYAVLPDPNASCMEDARYILEVHRVPLFEVMQRFPERGHLVDPDGRTDDDYQRPKVTGGGGRDIVSAQFRSTGVSGEFPGTATAGIPGLFSRAGGRKEDYTETVRLTEAWIRCEETITVPVIEDGERVEDQELTVPYWDFVAVANGIVLTPDKSNPFAHGQAPYIRLPYVEIGEWWGLQMTEQILPAQIAINRLLAAFQLNAELTGNPIFINPDSSGLTRTKINGIRPGGQLNPHAGAANFVRWLDPPKVSTDVVQLIGYYQDSIDRITGATSIMRASTFRRREAAGTVDAVQEAAFSRIRKALRNYEEALRNIANQTLSNFVQFYVEPRTVPIVGPAGASESLTLGHKHFYIPQTNTEGTEIVEDVPLRFQAWVNAGSSLPLSRSALAAQALQLREMGAIDNLSLLRAVQWPDAEKTHEAAQQMLQTGIMTEAMKRSQGGS